MKRLEPISEVCNKLKPIIIMLILSLVSFQMIYNLIDDGNVFSAKISTWNKGYLNLSGVDFPSYIELSGELDVGNQWNDYTDKDGKAMLRRDKFVIRND